jgi:antitoxin CptB
MKELERVRWRCRRGMLELDIVLGRFIEQHYASLNRAQQAALDRLLDMPDPTLWDMIANAGVSPLQSERCGVLELLQAA